MTHKAKRWLFIGIAVVLYFIVLLMIGGLDFFSALLMGIMAFFIAESGEQAVLQRIDENKIRNGR